MPTRSRLAGLLLRGSLLMIGVLTLWRLALQTPLLAMLRTSEDVALRLLGSDSGDPIAVETSGDWTFQVPVAAPASGRANPAEIRSVEFSISRSDLVLFTFSLPVYCAIAWIVPVSRAGLRALFWGAGIVALVEVLSLLGFIEITAHSVATQMEHIAAGSNKWPSEFGNYLLTQVIPFAAPVLIAVISRRDLRSQVFPEGLVKPDDWKSKIEQSGTRSGKRRPARNQSGDSKSRG